MEQALQAEVEDGLKHVEFILHISLFKVSKCVFADAVMFMYVC